MARLRRNVLLKSIQECIQREGIDVSKAGHRFLLVRLHGLCNVLYEDHAPTAAAIAAKAIERAPRAQGPPIYDNRPPFDCGAIFDAATDEILAYEFKPL
jgi:hypothetical protein